MNAYIRGLPLPTWLVYRELSSKLIRSTKQLWAQTAPSEPWPLRLCGYRRRCVVWTSPFVLLVVVFLVIFCVPFVVCLSAVLRFGRFGGSRFD